MSRDLHVKISDELDYMITILEKKLNMTRSEIVREAIKLYFLAKIEPNLSGEI